MPVTRSILRPATPRRSGMPQGARRLAAAALALLVSGAPAGAGAFPDLAAAPAPHIQGAPPVDGARLEPLTYAALDGWGADRTAEAFRAFLNSCEARDTLPPERGPPANPALAAGLARACRAARALGTQQPSDTVARLFFEANFRPYRIVPKTRGPGFLTGYYEVEVEGSRVRTAQFTVPVLARPTDLVPGDPERASNRGAVFRREGDRLVPYPDRAAIEDGALDGQGLEICYLRQEVDLFFMQIQGSGRIRLTDGHVLRLNYDGHNGQPYLPVGRLLIERGVVPREEMSLERIRAFIAANPEAGRALMRENRSYVFFKAVDLPPDAGALGAEGVPLTALRSIAVDRARHGYGTPFFISADLPLGGEAPSAFRRLMIAQDTGSAIVGPARADLFFGAGAEAGRLAGAIRHPGTFTLLVPRLQDVGGRP